MDPALYHAHHNLYQEDISFWLKLAEKSKSPILELGCGTGRVLIKLAQAGYQVLGLDNDPSMLRYLSYQLSAHACENVRLFQADMCHFHLSVQAGLIILPCNTLSTIPENDRQRMFNTVRRHLSDKGIFAASMPNPGVLRRLPAQSELEIEEVIEHPSDGEPVQVGSAWAREKDTFTVTWTYDHLISNGQVERHIATIKHYLITPDQLIQELSLAGCTNTRFYGDFNLAPYRKSSPYLILLSSPYSLPDL